MTRDMNPVLLSLNCGSPDDTWLRNMARGVISVQIPPIQHVILQGSAEADRVYAAWARLSRSAVYRGVEGCSVSGKLSCDAEDPRPAHREGQH